MARRSFKAGALALIVGVLAGAACGSTRLLYWNIQDGMWDGQTDNFNRFVAWVQKQSPDICVFAEVRTKRQTGKMDHVKDESQRILPAGWPKLAARYGHDHVWISSDNPKCYMQGITSRFPIESVAKDLVPTGSGWARIRVGTNVLNIVTVHLNWTPWGRGCKSDEERKASAAKFGGDLARRDEIETVLKGSFFTVPDASNQYWVVAGDYNARSPVDARMYDIPLDSPRYAVHRWLAESTPLVDLMHEWLPNDFHVTGGAKSRIDYVYLTRGLYDHVEEARVVVDRYTRPTYSGVSDIWRPSDHRPILVDFDFRWARQLQNSAGR